MPRPAPPAAIAPSAPDGRRALRAFLRHGAFTALACVALAALLWALNRRMDFGVVLLYSVLIGTFCWLFSDGTGLLVSALLARRQPTALRWRSWPGWGWALVIVPGTVLGVLVGGLLGDALTGRRSPRPLLDPSGQVLGVLVVSLLMATGITAFFTVRERLAAAKAQAVAAERLAVETRLALLQSQLEPHMLFNTLANLRVLIALDAPRAQAMLDRLIAFLRATLAASRAGAHPLAAEFERIADYLALIGVRMGPRLQITLELPESLRALPVPPLLLQPLVENSVQHGLEPKVDGGRIEVRAAREGDRLVLTVRDTGLGLSGAPASTGTRFGLQQVRERLQTLYGDTASLTLTAADDGEGGTRVCIELPISPP